MTRIKEYRIELIIQIILALIFATTMAWFAIARSHPVLWLLAVPFILIIPFLIRKAIRYDPAIKEELEKEDLFTKKYPVINLILIIVGSLNIIFLIINLIYPRTP